MSYHYLYLSAQKQRYQLLISLRVLMVPSPAQFQFVGLWCFHWSFRAETRSWKTRAGNPRNMREECDNHYKGLSSRIQTLRNHEVKTMQNWPFDGILKHTVSSLVSFRSCAYSEPKTWFESFHSLSFLDSTTFVSKTFKHLRNKCGAAIEGRPYSFLEPLCGRAPPFTYSLELATTSLIW